MLFRSGTCSPWAARSWELWGPKTWGLRVGLFPKGSAEGRGEGRWGDKQERVGTWITTRQKEASRVERERGWGNERQGDRIEWGTERYVAWRERDWGCREITERERETEREGGKHNE